MLSFKQDKFIRKNQLVSGNAYVFKDGHVRIYIGMNRRSEELLFYTVGRMAFQTVSLGEVSPLWGDWQVNILKSMCKSVLSLKYNFSAVSTYRYMPSIYESIGFIFTVGELEGWLMYSGHGNMVKYTNED